MRQKNQFYGRESLHLDAFAKQVAKCHHNTSSLRGAVRSIGDENKVFFLWEAEKPLAGEEQLVFQHAASFSEAEDLFFLMLSILGNAGWQSNPETVNKFLNKLNKSIDYTHEQATLLPVIIFTKAFSKA